MYCVLFEDTTKQKDIYLMRALFVCFSLFAATVAQLETAMSEKVGSTVSSCCIYSSKKFAENA